MSGDASTQANMSTISMDAEQITALKIYWLPTEKGKNPMRNSITKTALLIILGALCQSLNAGEIGWATFYTTASAKKEGTSGILTASGKRYDESKMTCALPKQTAQAWGLKFGQKVRVTNMANGRTALLTYTDRGPGLKSRSRGTIIDLTPAAFRALGGKLKDGRIKIKIKKGG